MKTSKPRYPDHRCDLAIVAAAKLLHVPYAEIIGPSVAQSIVEARQVSMHVVRRCFRMSYAEIGRGFGRNHVCILHADRAMKRKSMADATLRRIIDTLIAQVRGGGKA